MTRIPSSHADILKKKTFAHIATLMPDGSPQVSPVWVDVEGDYILINSADGRVKDENMKRDPLVALSATDPDNPYRCVMIRGRVERITQEGADEAINRLAKKYMDVDEYPFRKPGEQRVNYYIKPESVATMG